MTSEQHLQSAELCEALAASAHRSGATLMGNGYEASARMHRKRAREIESAVTAGA